MIITSINDRYVDDILRDAKGIKILSLQLGNNNKILMYQKNMHPIHAIEEANRLVSDTSTNWIVYDTNILNNINPENILFVEPYRCVVNYEEFINIHKNSVDYKYMLGKIGDIILCLMTYTNERVEHTIEVPSIDNNETKVVSREKFITHLISSNNTLDIKAIENRAFYVPTVYKNNGKIIAATIITDNRQNYTIDYTDLKSLAEKKALVNVERKLYKTAPALVWDKKRQPEIINTEVEKIHSIRIDTVINIDSIPVSGKIRTFIVRYPNGDTKEIQIDTSTSRVKYSKRGHSIVGLGFDKNTNELKEVKLFAPRESNPDVLSKDTIYILSPEQYRYYLADKGGALQISYVTDEAYTHRENTKSIRFGRLNGVLVYRLIVSPYNTDLEDVKEFNRVSNGKVELYYV